MVENDAEDMALRCCVCGTSAEDDSNYLNTKMKMLISKCGHRLYVSIELSTAQVGRMMVLTRLHCCCFVAATTVSSASSSTTARSRALRARSS